MNPLARGRRVCRWLSICISLVCATPLMKADHMGNAQKYPAYPLKKITVDVENTAALQRGAKTFMNYCSGCHSLKYVRYDKLARDMDITTLEGKIDETLLRNLIFDPQNKISDPLVAAMSPEDARVWFGFGLPAPDLSLVARSRSANWLILI